MATYYFVADAAGSRFRSTGKWKSAQGLPVSINFDPAGSVILFEGLGSRYTIDASVDTINVGGAVVSGTALEKYDAIRAVFPKANTGSGGSGLLTLSDTLTGNYTAVLSDVNKLKMMNVASANTFTVPPNSSVAFPLGSPIIISQDGAGATSLVAGAGVTLNGNLTVGGQYKSVVIIKTATNTWKIFGGVADTTAPTIATKATGSTTTIVITFSEVVTTSAVTGWSFKKNGSTLSASAVSGSGTNVLTFTVATMANGDTILCSYSSSAGDTLDASGNELASVTDSGVTNNIPDTTAPTVSSATATDLHTIVIVLSENVTATNVGWTFKQNGSSITPTAISGSGTNTLTFTVSQTLLNSDTILRSYSSSTGDTMDAASNEVVTFTDQSVTNSISGLTNSEATAYFSRLATAGYASNNTEKGYYDAFVTAAKSNGYYTKLKALCVYLGSANSHRVLNAISSSYTQAWGSGVSFVAGVKGDGTSNGYINTNFIPSTESTINDTAWGYWITENINGTADLGVKSSTTSAIVMLTRYSDGNGYFGSYNEGGSTFGTTIANASGFWILSRISSASLKLYRNGSAVYTSTTVDSGVSLPDRPIYLLAKNDQGTVEPGATRTQKISFLASGLTDTDATNFYNDMSTFLTAIGR